jgi:hypothetical protein
MHAWSLATTFAFHAWRLQGTQGAGFPCARVDAGRLADRYLGARERVQTKSGLGSRFTAPEPRGVFSKEELPYLRRGLRWP